MSSTSTKRPWADAQRDAIEFCSYFAGAHDSWVIAGSVRRHKMECGDVEHVCIPRDGDIEIGGLFAASERGNLVWDRLESMLKMGTISKHIYGTMGFRWGPKYRGVDFQGYLHEIFTAQPDGFGATLAIRTGPADFSKQLVIDIRRRGLCCDEGVVKYIGTESVYPVRTEEAFFEACGREWIAPEKRA